MAKKSATVSPPPVSKRPLIAPIAMAAISCGLLMGAYFAVVWLGRAAAESVAQRAAYRARFDQVPWPVPPHVHRETFLTEVRYLGSPPREFSLADASARSNLAAAFARHPWVKSAVPVDASPVPVAMTFRIPILSVAIVDGSDRLVDRHGVLLPTVAWPEPLPRFLTPQPAPLTPAGEIWLHPHLPKAIEFAGDYQAWLIELSSKSWTFRSRTGQAFTLPR
jgi:hypothetical protein